MSNNENYTQVCVWPGTNMEGSTVEEFETFVKDQMGARAKFIEVIETLPDLDSKGNPVPDTGGRTDLFFRVHQDDIEGKFLINRLTAGVRWVEDVLSEVNGGIDEEGNPVLYPKRVLNYISWNANS